jgi:hypothetical protein
LNADLALLPPAGTSRGRGDLALHPQEGMIYSPSHGDTEFTVPLFGEFILRFMECPVQAAKQLNSFPPVPPLFKGKSSARISPAPPYQLYVHGQPPAQCE